MSVSGFGLLTIVLTALITLFAGIVAFWILFPTILPSFMNSMDNVVSSLNLPAQTYEVYYAIKDLINKLYWMIPIALIIAISIFVITRSAPRESDIY
ncbi:MAG: hypothetical protein QXM12_07095 [Nitrososphaerota archaeon]